VNLAVFYGLGLIVLALILAVIYSKACTIIEKSVLPEQEAAKTEKKPLAVEGAEK
jgi:K+-transporting ATPase c subunit